MSISNRNFHAFLRLFTGAVFIVGILQKPVLADVSSSNVGQNIRVVYSNSDPVFVQALKSFKSSQGNRFVFKWLDQSELKSRLLEVESSDDVPEIVIASSDIMGLHAQLKLSQISPQQFLKFTGGDQNLLDITKAGDGKLYGLPLARGNHLVLYYNWAHVQSVAGNWHELMGQRYSIDEEVDLIGWSVLDMYWLIPFISAHGELPVTGNAVKFNEVSTSKALEFVWNLIDKKVVDLDCNYQCNKEKFTNSQLAYHINGVWEYEYFKEQLGEDLGISNLPSVGEKPMQPYHALTYVIFPRLSLQGSEKNAIEEFLQYTISPGFHTILSQSMSTFALANLGLSLEKEIASDDHKVVQYTLSESQPMPHNEKMFLVWEALLKGFVRFGGGAFESYEAVSYMQRYVDEEGWLREWPIKVFSKPLKSNSLIWPCCLWL